MNGCVLDLMSDYTAVVDSDMPVKEKALKVKRRSNEGKTAGHAAPLKPIERSWEI